MSLSADMKEVASKFKVESAKPDFVREFVSTGSIIADYLLDGGFGKGRINEVYGENSSGKTTLAIMAAVQMQRAGKAVVFIDAEAAFDDLYAKGLGLDFHPDKWAKIVESNYVKVGKSVSTLMRNAKKNNVGMIIIDSTTALGKDAEEELEDIGKAEVGIYARFWSRYARILASDAKKYGVTLLVISQVRAKIDSKAVSKYATLEDKESTTGGNAMKFYRVTSLRLQKSSKQQEDQKDVTTGKTAKKVTGNLVLIKNMKNKLGEPHRQGYATMTYGNGFDNLSDSMNFLFATNKVKDAVHKEDTKTKKKGEKKANYYTITDLDGEELEFHGKDNVIAYLKDRPELVATWINESGISQFNYFE